MGALRPFGVGVVGLGVGEQHARAFAALADCRVMRVTDLDRSRAKALAAEIPGCDVSDTFDEMLHDDSIDIVSIASFDADHYKQVVAAISAGKHVFVEKPVCRDGDELAHVGRLLRAAQRPIHVNSNLVLRGAALYGWLKREIDAGAIGRIYAFDGEYLYGRLHKITEGWRVGDDKYSVVKGGGIHLIDLMLWLTGQRPEAATAVGNRISTDGTAFLGFDFVAATLTFPTGLIGRLSCNFGCVHRHQHVVRIFGTKQTFILDDAGPRIMMTRDPAVPASRIPLDPLPSHKGVLIPSFVERIRSGAAMSADELQQLLDPIAVADACDAALASGQLERIVYQ
jgi:predicted dehydrogenase